MTSFGPLDGFKKRLYAPEYKLTHITESKQKLLKMKCELLKAP